MIERALAASTRWSSPLLATFADQALFSGSHLVLQVVLARHLTPEAYGSFAVAFAALLFLAGFHGAVVSEPMSVLGARRDSARLGPYLGAVLALHFRLVLPASALLACGMVLAGAGVAPVLATTLGLAASLPWILLFWLLRAACYLKGRPDLALRGSAVYATALLALLGLRLGVFPPAGFRGPEVFGVLAIASLAAAAALWRPIGPRWPRAEDGRGLFAEHWSYGRWILAASVANGVSTLAVTPLLALSAGLAQGGAFRALQNLTMPLQQVFAAVGILALPRLARRAATDPPAFRRSALLLVGATGAAATAYAITLWLTGGWLFDVLYRNPYYRSLTSMLPVVAVTLVVAAVAQASGIVQRAAGRPDAVMWAKGAAAAAFVTVGWFTIPGQGIAGALSALLVGAATEAGVLLAFGLRKGRKDSSSSRT
ncbi:MAG: hypothetical protein ABW221_20650 [Vicinamibacteria bacterium]